MPEARSSELDPEKSKRRVVETSSLGDLERLVNSEKWREFSGNYSRPDALVPKDLSAHGIVAVLRAISESEIFKTDNSGRLFQSKPAFTPKVIADLGKLEEIGHGEGKVALGLTTKDGKRMAVIVGGYYSQCGLKISEDPKLFVTSTNRSTRARVSYSDLRQYIGIPLTVDGNDMGVILEEYGGNQRIGWLGNLDPRMHLSGSRALGYVGKHKKGMNLVIDGNTLSELNHTRHYLFQPGAWAPAVIDIPITQILR